MPTLLLGRFVERHCKAFFNLTIIASIIGGEAEVPILIRMAGMARIKCFTEFL